jgi:hypothetical protein
MADGGCTMEQSSFTRAQAQAKVGRRVRTRIAFAEVPAGALGTVVRVDRVIDGYDLEVAWARPGCPTPWVEWFTKAEYAAHLIEVQEPRGAARPSRPAPAADSEDGIQ